MDRIARVAPTLGVAAVLWAACGGTTTSPHPSTTPLTSHSVDGVALPQTVRSGRLSFRVPASWVIGHGTCRCNWGTPATATVDNGPQQGGVACSCPMEASTAPSALHLYAGQGGLVPTGVATTINGVRATVDTDPSDSTMSATFPEVDQWITIGPAPEPRPALADQQQLALERQILATVRVDP